MRSPRLPRLSNLNALIQAARGRLEFGLMLGIWLLACEDSVKVSTEHAKQHAQELAGYVAQDVEQVRNGLPQGAKLLGPEWKDDQDPSADPQQVRRDLARTREKVSDLSIAKSTFFAFVLPEGSIVRTDQEVDGMAGKNLFQAFPKLRAATEGYVEARGDMPEAAGVKGKPEGQWVAATPIKFNGETRAIYATGWSWASYCFRLEFGLRSSVRSSLTDDQGNIDKEPLIYAFMVVGDQVFSAPATPQINADEIAKLDVLGRLEGEAAWAKPLEITGREFGFAAQRTPSLGDDVAVAVLRSET